MRARTQWAIIGAVAFAMYAFAWRGSCECSSSSSIFERYNAFCSTSRTNLVCTVSCSLTGHFHTSKWWWSCLTLWNIMDDIVLWMAAWFLLSILRLVYNTGSHNGTMPWTMERAYANMDWVQVHNNLVFLITLLQLFYWVRRVFISRRHE
jgi:hypothetical protein